VSETKTPALKTAASGGQKIMTELKVTGHLMTFDAGLYCIFTPPGSPISDPQTGLPGIRISLPPGPAFRPEAINISTFREDGWLGGWNGAALVRVARGPAHILVTIYQAPNSKGEAPKLQIMRLTDAQAVHPPAAQAAGQPAAPAPQAAAQAVAAPPAAIPAPAAPPPPAQNTPAGAAAKPVAASGPAEVVAHIQTRGDVTGALVDWMGVPGSKHWIEGFSIAPKQMIGAADIEYQAVLGRGWLSPWAEGGQFCGSRSMSLPILGLRVRLRGEAADRFDCALSASFVDGTKIGPLDNGEPCQAESLAPLESFRVDITPRGAEPEAAAPKPARKAPAAPPTLAAASAKAGGAKPAAAKPAPAKAAPAPAPKPTRRK
jgi:hypothetical protein